MKVDFSTNSICKLFFQWILALCILPVFAQSVQVIHNSPGAPAVDVWVNGSTVLSGVTYKQASGFLPLSAGVNTIQIAVSGSNPYTIVSTDEVNIAAGTDYRAIATGIVGSTVVGQGFVVHFSTASSTLPATGNVGLAIYHSAPGAPEVGVVARDVATLVTSFQFRDAPTLVQVPASRYVLNVNLQHANGMNFKSFSADLSGYSNLNIAIIATGIINDTTYPFGLFAVLDDGTVVELPEVKPAKVQVIHNSPGAPAVDVWVNGMTVLSGVTYRQASEFLDVKFDKFPSTVQIAVTGSSPYDIVSTDILTLTSEVSYRAIATGIVGATVAGQEFDVHYSVAKTTDPGSANVGLDIIHNSPNAPAVGVVARGVGALVNAFGFKDAPQTLTVPGASYDLLINGGSASGGTVAAFTADISALSGTNIAVIASGLLGDVVTPFGLIAVLKNGTVVTLPSLAPAKVQVLHNSPGAPAVDVWVNGTTVLGGVTYRKASGFLDVALLAYPTTVQIAVTGSNPYTIVSTDIISLTSGMSYRAIATGIVGSTVTGQEFDVHYSNATTNTPSSGNVGLDIIHSSPDAPTVGVVARGVATLVESFNFKSAPVSLEVPAAAYTLDIKAGNASGNTVASFTTTLTGLSGENIAVVASGLLGSTETSFGLIAILEDGTVIVLDQLVAPAPVSVVSASTSAIKVYPNPATDYIYVTGAEILSVEILNLNGQVISSSTVQPITVSSLAKGMYIVKVITEKGTTTGKFYKN